MTNRSQLGIIFDSMLFYDYCVCGSHVWLCDAMDCSPPGSFVYGKNREVDNHAFIQGIFRTQGLNLGLLDWRQILYSLSHKKIINKG